jgi:hypothetical protein
MNNNNLYNTNNFIGITHNDYFKTASNALATAINTLDLNSSNYTCNVSNILDNKITNVNINSSNYTRDTSNAILARYDPMIENRYELKTLIDTTTYETKHTYINNSNLYGEIRFWGKSTNTFYNPFQPYPIEAPEYIVKIDIDGKLKCYYTYDALLNATYGSGWVDIINSIVGLNADSVNQGTLITGLEAQLLANISSLQAQISQMLIEFEEDALITPSQRARIDNELQNLAIDTTTVNGRTTMQELYRLYREGINGSFPLNRLKEAIDLINLRISQNAAAGFFLGLGGAAFGFMYGLINEQKHNEFLHSLVVNKISSNINFTDEQKRVLYSSNYNDMNSNIINQLEYTSNITASQGFINTYNTNQQTIPSLLTSSLNLNSGNITQINTINSTTGIFGSISTTNNTNEAIPSLGNFGGIGDKMIIKAGSLTTYPYSIGYETNALWMSSEDNTNFYNKGIKTLSLTSDNNIEINNGNITGINTINATTSIFGTVSTTNNTNEAIPSLGNFGGIGDKMIIKAGSSTTYPYSIGYETNALWMSSESNINFYNKGVKTLSLTQDNNIEINNGNITGINNLTVNTLNISGKIQQFGNYLDETYLKPEDLYNLTYTYTTERRYPPKAYNTSTTEKTVNFVNTFVYNQILFLDNIGITYGYGQYEIYSSSTYDNGITNKDKLFNFDAIETVNTPRWAINQYNSGTGDYQGNSSIDSVHYGDWIIIKLPLPFLLTRFRIYKNTAFSQLAPSLWKCFGSFDGIEFAELFQAHNFVRLTEADYNLGYYEKTLVSSFTTLYNYIGFSFNSLVGVSGATSLNFSELQLFGKEQLSYNIDSYKYTTPDAVKVVVRDDMPDVSKKAAMIVSIPASATYYDDTSSTTYYKYDLDLRLYTNTKTIENTTDLMRIFRIRFWYVPSYFSSYIDGQPWVSSYEVYMSKKLNPILGHPETAGLNVYAVGFPKNEKLNNILPNQLMLLQNAFGSINYISIVSRTAPVDIYVIIEDLL